MRSKLLQSITVRVLGQGLQSIQRTQRFCGSGVPSGLQGAGLLNNGNDLRHLPGAAGFNRLPEGQALGFGASTFRFAAPIGTMSSVDDLAGTRIATSYEGIVGTYLADRGIEAEVVRLDGAVESSVRLGVADAIADVEARRVVALPVAAVAEGGVEVRVYVDHRGHRFTLRPVVGPATAIA